MPSYTVVGYYDDTMQGFADTVEAVDALAAMVQIANTSSPNGNLNIIGAFEGEHELIGPSDETDNISAAVDLAAIEDGE